VSARCTPLPSPPSTVGRGRVCPPVQRVCSCHEAQEANASVRAREDGFGGMFDTSLAKRLLELMRLEAPGGGGLGFLSGRVDDPAEVARRGGRPCPPRSPVCVARRC
jgi:hypothetical protein